MKARWGAACALPLLAALAAPFAGALPESDLRVSAVEVPDHPLRPEAESAAIRFTLEVGCQRVLSGAAGLPGGSDVTITPRFPAHVLVTGPNTLFADPAPCQAGADYSPIHAEYHVVVGRGAPGLRALQGTFNVSMPSQAPPALPPPPDTVIEALVIAAPEMRLAVGMERSLVSVSGQKAEVAFTVTNLGNVRTHVMPTALATAGARLDFEGPLLLDTPNSGNGTPKAILRATFLEPPGAWGEAQATVAFTPSAAEAPWPPGEPATARLLFRNANAAERAVPAPTALPLFLFAALAAARRP